MYDMTFSILKILNKYTEDDDKINQKILNDEEIYKQNENLNKYINNNKKVEHIIDQPNDNTSNDLIQIDDKCDEFKFVRDEDISNSFQKVFKNNKVIYTPSQKSKNIYVNYLLRKLNNSEDVPKDIFNHFNTTLSNLKLKNRIIPVEYDDGELFLKDKITKQTGQSINNNNNIKVKDLDKGILRVRYSNNKINKRMINAVKFNKDIHKLSTNERNIYYELQKFLNKEQDINVLIGSYLSGNNSKSLFNKINKMLYNKLKIS